tara:strand:+ start:214 stop:429 length:216 start_codon:yes stop_codon:yes gene_type:complete
MANYSSKHYNEFASLIEDEFDIDRKYTTAEMCLRLFIPDNSRFDADRFLKACGLESDYHLQSLAARMYINK